ncbi:3-beta hydroxysteroid dehydrogenase [Halobacteriales archaeon QS_7_69_60]|nr:MAG: 3-beta hydroxysteroid dehydrogenase [Halobacteriales archaeon QS_7_69_60]
MEPDDVDVVFVAGASGGTGREVLRLLGGREPTVRALTRSAERRERLLAAGADEVVVDDLLDPTDLRSPLEGVDVVLSAVGSGVAEVWSSGPVMESALGVGDEPASALATTFNLFIGPVQRAKAEAEAALRAAPVRHTVLRPGALTNGSRIDDVTVAEPGAKLWGLVSRADVARLMVAAPTTPDAADRTFEVVATPSFRDRALAVDWRLPGREAP